MLGVTYVRENGGEFTGTTPVDDFLTGFTTVKNETQKSLDFFIPNLYVTRTTNDGYISYGVGVFTPFGLGQEYENKSTSIFRNQITKIDLQTIVVNPTIAFKVNDMLSFGSGSTGCTGRRYWRGPHGTPPPPRRQKRERLRPQAGRGRDAWGYNFGVLLKPTKKLPDRRKLPQPVQPQDQGRRRDRLQRQRGSSRVCRGERDKSERDRRMPATFALGPRIRWAG